MIALTIGLFSFLVSACSGVSSPQLADDLPPAAPLAAEVISAMGTGFNLGNTFDNGQHDSSLEEIRPIINLYQDAGMKHIRIPVTWMEGFKGNTLADDDGHINFDHPRFIQLKAVIDYALERGLYVVLNAHHEREFKEKYDGSAEFDARFTQLWQEIAQHFKDYPHTLIFELLNEPEGAFGDSREGRSATDEKALNFTRHIFAIGHEAIRKTGGNNAKRLLMIATNGLGNQKTIEEVYPSKAALPGAGEDRYIAIQVHTYDPWQFCGQDGSNDKYPGKAAIEAAIHKVAAHARLLEVPINYGEYGVGRRDNISERNADLVKEFYRTIVQTTIKENFSSTVWDDRGWFGLVRKDDTGSYYFVNDIVPAMLAP